MFLKDFKSGNEILLEKPCGLKGCTSIIILQNWRNILRIEERNTSGTKASDVWSEPEIYEISAKQLNEILVDQIISPYGDEISIVSH